MAAHVWPDRRPTLEGGLRASSSAARGSIQGTVRSLVGASERTCSEPRTRRQARVAQVALGADRGRRTGGHARSVSCVSSEPSFAMPPRSSPARVRLRSSGSRSYSSRSRTFGGLFVGPIRDAILTKSRIVVAAGALLVVAVVIAPVGHDIWSYAMYGRIVSVHHASPYTHVPADYPHDPLLHLVGWRRTPSVYGPGFVGLAALGYGVHRLVCGRDPAVLPGYRGARARRGDGDRVAPDPRSSRVRVRRSQPGADRGRDRRP